VENQLNGDRRFFGGCYPYCIIGKEPTIAIYTLKLQHILKKSNTWK